ncbi:MAG: cadherin domain-containing protein, partial [Planctomycetaceae bacterium]
NDAPVLDNTGTMTLTTISEDQTASSGDTIASIIASAGGNRITDVDAAASEGIAITATTNGTGTWQYSTDGGTNWINVGATSDASALLLRSTDSLRFVPDGSNATSGDITFRAWDQTSGTAGTKVDVSSNGGTTAFSAVTEVASITATEVNDEQVISVNLGMSVSEGTSDSVITAAMLEVTDADHNADDLVYTLSGNVTFGQLRLNGVLLDDNDTFTQQDIQNGLLTYDHDGSENHSDAFSFTVDDGSGTVSSGTFSITVTPVNDNTPAITSDGGGATADVSNAENTTVVTTVTASDADMPGDTLTYSIVGGADATAFTIDANTGELAFVVAPDFELPTDDDGDQTYLVTVRVSDGVTSADQTISVSVTDANEFAVTAPSDSNLSANSVSENAADGTAVGITATASDSDASTNVVTYSLVDDAGGRFAIDTNTGVVTVADGSLLDFETADSHDIVIHATSQDGSTATQTMTIDISDENDNPPVIAAGQSFVVAENLPAPISVGFIAASDVDGNGSIQNWQIISDSSGGGFTIDAVTGEVTTTASFDYESASAYTLVIRVDDGVNDSADQSITINIGNVNEAPMASADAYAIRTDQILSVTMPGLLANDFDIEADGMFPVLVAGPSQGVLTLNADGSFSYDPNAGFLGTDSFQYQVSDGGLLSNVVTVTVRVNAVAASTPPPTTTPPPIAEPAPSADNDDGDEGDDNNDQDDSALQPGAAGSLVVANGSASNDAGIDPAPAQASTDQNAAAGNRGDAQGTLEDALADSLRGAAGRSDGDRRYLDAAAMMSPVELVMMQRMLQADLEQAIVWSEWDKLREGGGGDGLFGDFAVGTAGATAGLVSVGYVMWALRGGVFLATAYSSLPAWRMLDPATLLISYRSKKADGADDSLERLLG